MRKEMKKDVYEAMIRLCVDSFRDIEWEWEGLTSSERVAIGSKDTFEAIKAEASDFLVKTPKPYFEAVLMRTNPQYAESNPQDIEFFTSVKDYWVCEWVIFKMPEQGAEYDEWEEQDLYFEDKLEAMAKAEEMNRA